MGDLDQRLLAAHASGDARSLVTLYREAADAAPDADAAGFYLTHAWVYALETGHPETDALFERLVAQGRA